MFRVYLFCSRAHQGETNERRYVPTKDKESLNKKAIQMASNLREHKAVDWDQLGGGVEA